MEIKELVKLVDLVLEWASKPQDHGGNPYTKDFVLSAEKLKDSN